jgi:hypothetical protein
MSQSVSGGDVTTTGDDLDQNFDGSVDSNDDFQILNKDYEKGKTLLINYLIKSIQNK